IFRRLICQVAANALNKIFATAYNELRKLRTEGQSYADLLTWILRRRDGGSGRFLTMQIFAKVSRRGIAITCVRTTDSTFLTYWKMVTPKTTGILPINLPRG